VTGLACDFEAHDENRHSSVQGPRFRGNFRNYLSSTQHIIRLLFSEEDNMHIKLTYVVFRPTNLTV